MLALLAYARHLQTPHPPRRDVWRRRKRPGRRLRIESRRTLKRSYRQILVAVYAEGVSDMEKELAGMQKWEMKSFAISDYKVTI